jgi:hypothetical protein
MASDASPRPTDPKMNKSLIHLAETSSFHACAQDGYFKRPHPTTIDVDVWLDSGWFLGDFVVVVGHLSCN